MQEIFTPSLRFVNRHGGSKISTVSNSCFCFDEAKTPCVEESETAVQVSLLEYWNHKEGRERCVHQNKNHKAKRKTWNKYSGGKWLMPHLPPTFAIIINTSHASLYLTSGVPCLMSPSPSSCVPQSQVPKHVSQCPRPTFIHNPCERDINWLAFREQFHQGATERGFLSRGVMGSKFAAWGVIGHCRYLCVILIFIQRVTRNTFGDKFSRQNYFTENTGRIWSN